MPPELAQLGLAGLVIATLATTVLYVYRELKAERVRNDSLQEKRIEDARETRDKITEQMDAQYSLTKQIYDYIISSTNSRRGR